MRSRGGWGALRETERRRANESALLGDMQCSSTLAHEMDRWFESALMTHTPGRKHTNVLPTNIRRDCVSNVPRIAVVRHHNNKSCVASPLVSETRDTSTSDKPQRGKHDRQERLGDARARP